MNTFIGILFLIDVLVVTAAIYKIYHSMFNVVYFKLSAYFGEILVMLAIAAGIVGVPGAMLAEKLYGEEALKPNLDAFLGEHSFFVILYLVAFFLIWTGLAVYFAYMKQRR